MQTIPAGVSKKTGRPYNAFQTCPNKCPKPAYNRQVPQNFPPQVVAQVSKPDTNWDKISWGKCKYGFMIELMKQGKDVFVAELEAEKWADAAMRKAGKPEVTTTHGYPQVNQNPFDDPIPTIDVSQIPM